MRFVVFIFVAGLGVSASEKTKGVICEPNSVHKEDCNTCKCSADGTLRSCTMMMCHEEIIDSSATHSKREISHKSHCTPGKSFKLYCNICACGPDGLSGSCTRKMCPEGIYNEDGTMRLTTPVPDQSLLRKPRQVNEKRSCTPGKPFKLYCNTCACGPDGFAGPCTRKACPEDIYNEDGTMRLTTPVPDQSLLRKPRQVNEKRSCTPGKPFKLYCNTCACGPDGFAGPCTRKACPEDIYNEDGTMTLTTPVPDQSLLRQPRQVNEKRSCTPGKPFKLYCNTCACRPGGFVGPCTRKMCPEGIYNEDGTMRLTTPVPDQSLLRQPRQVNEKRSCTPGKPFKLYCNTCACGPGGFVGPCTRKMCPEGVYNEDGTMTLTTPVPNQSLLRQPRQVNEKRSCTPGKPFKLYCNTCACGPDGFAGPCTRKACPEGIYNEDGSLKTQIETTNKIFP